MPARKIQPVTPTDPKGEAVDFPRVVATLLPSGELSLEVHKFPTVMLMGLSKLIEVQSMQQFANEQENARRSRGAKPGLFLP